MAESRAGDAFITMLAGYQVYKSKSRSSRIELARERTSQARSVNEIPAYYLDKGSPIIKQDRVGLHGKQFKMYKFRTMKKDSHELRGELSDLNKHRGPLFKIEDDPRIIKGTEFLRKYSLDELPQVINVLKGDMSMVGPRPLFKEDTKLFNQVYMRRLNVLPGITGLLQINDRNTPDFSIWHKYDIEYIDNWSIYLDFKIMINTPKAIFKSKTKGY